MPTYLPIKSIAAALGLPNIKVKSFTGLLLNARVRLQTPVSFPSLPRQEAGFRSPLAR